jgi:hypothetical protein
MIATLLIAAAASILASLVTVLLEARQQPAPPAPLPPTRRLQLWVRIPGTRETAVILWDRSTLPFVPVVLAQWAIVYGFDLEALRVVNAECERLTVAVERVARVEDAMCEGK